VIRYHPGNFVICKSLQYVAMVTIIRQFVSINKYQVNSINIVFNHCLYISIETVYSVFFRTVQYTVRRNLAHVGVVYGSQQVSEGDSEENSSH